MKASAHSRTGRASILVGYIHVIAPPVWHFGKKGKEGEGEGNEGNEGNERNERKGVCLSSYFCLRVSLGPSACNQFFMSALGRPTAARYLPPAEGGDDPTEWAYSRRDLCRRPYNPDTPPTTNTNYSHRSHRVHR